MIFPKSLIQSLLALYGFGNRDERGARSTRTNPDRPHVRRTKRLISS